MDNATCPARLVLLWPRILPFPLSCRDVAVNRLAERRPVVRVRHRGNQQPRETLKGAVDCVRTHSPGRPTDRQLVRRPFSAPSPPLTWCCSPRHRLPFFTVFTNSGPIS